HYLVDNRQLQVEPHDARIVLRQRSDDKSSGRGRNAGWYLVPSQPPVDPEIWQTHPPQHYLPPKDHCTSVMHNYIRGPNKDRRSLPAPPASCFWQLLIG